MPLKRIAQVFFAVAAILRPLAALQVTTYTPAANDRFVSGYPSAPVNNTSPSFVGLGYDWSGVGWASTDPTKSFGFLSPLHYLVARHYGGATTINLFGSDGQVHSATQASVAETGYGVVFSGQTVGDLNLGKLTAPTASSWGIARYGVLDLNSTSSANTSYDGEPAFLYGRGPDGSQSTRVGNTTVSGTYLSGNSSFLTTDRTQVQLESGDSGSPDFLSWTNPNGGRELTIVGNNAGIGTDSTSNIDLNLLNYIANSTLFNRLNEMMSPDGYALRIVGNPSATWTGSTSASLGSRFNWSPAAVPSDLYALFDAGTATRRSVTVNSATDLRGLYFKATASTSDGFTISGTSTLTIGRGGVTNYDESRQAFTANITLGDYQYWDVGTGGIAAQNINTNAKLLEIAGNSTSLISGQISGTGAIALSGGELDLSASSSYSGKTWVHSGTLNVTGSIASSSGVSLDADGHLQGTGSVSAISGSGTVDPGNNLGILTAPALDPSGGLDFDFEFTLAGSPNYSNATSSGNDLLRLTAATPFAFSLTSSNSVSVFFHIATLMPGDTFRGGFYTDAGSSFFSSIQSASFAYFIQDSGGSVTYRGVAYSPYTGPLALDLATVPETAPFAGSTQSGYVFQISAIPEPSTLPLAAAGVLLCAAFGGRRIKKTQPLQRTRCISVLCKEEFRG